MLFSEPARLELGLDLAAPHFPEHLLSCKSRTWGGRPSLVAPRAGFAFEHTLIDAHVFIVTDRALLIAAESFSEGASLVNFPICIFLFPNRGLIARLIIFQHVIFVVFLLLFSKDSIAELLMLCDFLSQDGYGMLVLPTFNIGLPHPLCGFI